MAARGRAAGLREGPRRAAPRGLAVRDLIVDGLLGAAVVVPVPHVGRIDAVTVAAFGLVAAAIAIATRRRPAIGIAILVIVSPFDFMRSLGPTTLTLPKMALLAVVLGLLVRRVSLAPLRAAAVRPVAFGALAVVLVTAATAIPATYPDATARETFKALEYALAFVVALVAYAADPDDRIVWNGIAIAALLVCALALVQEFTTAPSGLFLHGRIVPRIAGPLDGPNQLAGWCDLMLALVAARALLGPPSRPFAALAALVATTDALTLSRSGAFGALAALGMLVATMPQPNRTRRLAWAAVIAVVPLVAFATVLVTNDATGRFTGASLGAQDTGVVLRDGTYVSEDGLAPRARLWRAALAMWRTDPGLGVGAGNYELLTPTVGLVGVRTHANSAYLQALAEGGVALLAATLWTLGAPLAFARGRLRDPLVAGASAATLALAAHQLFDCLTFYPKVGGVWWLVVGLGAAASLRHPAKRGA